VKLAERPQIRVPGEAAPLLAQYIGDTDREVFVVALLTVRHRVLGLHTVSVGCLTSSLVHPREVFKPAILAGSAALLLAHNHPSGDPEPSAEDIALTRRLTSAGQLLGIEILDHLILGEAGRFVSLRERGVL
jgi:DNA repair protein RadC